MHSFWWWSVVGSSQVNVHSFIDSRFSQFPNLGTRRDETRLISNLRTGRQVQVAAAASSIWLPGYRLGHSPEASSRVCRRSQKRERESIMASGRRHLSRWRQPPSQLSAPHSPPSRHHFMVGRRRRRSTGCYRVIAAAAAAAQ